MSTKLKKKKAWFYDTDNNLTVSFREYEEGMSNNGEYYHHSWVGPFRTFNAAKKAGLKILSCELHLAQIRFRDFHSVKEKKMSKGEEK